jgi:hypothetical protein
MTVWRFLQTKRDPMSIIVTNLSQSIHRLLVVAFMWISRAYRSRDHRNGAQGEHSFQSNRTLYGNIVANSFLFPCPTRQILQNGIKNLPASWARELAYCCVALGDDLVRHRLTLCPSSCFCARGIPGFPQKTISQVSLTFGRIQNYICITS